MCKYGCDLEVFINQILQQGNLYNIAHGGTELTKSACCCVPATLCRVHLEVKGLFQYHDSPLSLFFAL